MVCKNCKKEVGEAINEVICGNMVLDSLGEELLNKLGLYEYMERRSEG